MKIEINGSSHITVSSIRDAEGNIEVFTIGLSPKLEKLLDQLDQLEDTGIDGLAGLKDLRVLRVTLDSQLNLNE